MTLMYVLSAIVILSIIYSIMVALGVPEMILYVLNSVVFNLLDYFPSVTFNAPRKGFGGVTPNESL